MPVEVWSPSTGDYDATEKVRLYESRLDEETWLLDPRSGTVTSFTLDPGRSCTERRYPRGRVPLAAFTGASVDVDAVLRAARL
jgi:Uma2 family endonuclease